MSGGIFRHGEAYRLYLGDCLEVMRRMPDGCVDAVICDPPYGVTSCRWDKALPLAGMWAEFGRLCRGAMVLFCSEPFTSELVMSNKKQFKEKLTWVKHYPTNPYAAKTRHLKYCEDIVVFAAGRYVYNRQYTARVSGRVREAQKAGQAERNKKRTTGGFFGDGNHTNDWKSWDPDRKLQGNVLFFNAVVPNSKEKAGHPTQKPVALLEYLVRTYTNEGDTVLDNCMGSGSTGVACMNTGRRFIGIEREESYYGTAERRLERILMEAQESYEKRKGGITDGQ